MLFQFMLKVVGCATAQSLVMLYNLLLDFLIKFSEVLTITCALQFLTYLLLNISQNKNIYIYIYI